MRKKKLNPIQKYAKNNPNSPYTAAFLQAFHKGGVSKKRTVKMAKFASMGKLDTRIYS